MSEPEQEPEGLTEQEPDREPEPDGVLWKISSGNTILCDNCGHSNTLGDENCEKCQTPLPIDDEDEESLSLMIGEDGPSLARAKKVLLEDATHLQNLKRACQGILSETMEVAEYQQIVKKIHGMTRIGVDLFNTDVVKKKIEDLPEDEVALVKDTQGEIEKYHAGVSMMMDFLKSGNREMVQAGFYTVEQALTKLDEIQDRAINMTASI